jgi:hypothetical protein
VYSNPDLQGSVISYRYNPFYTEEIVKNHSIYIGDLTLVDPFNQNNLVNCTSKGYITFNLPEILEGYCVKKANLRVKKSEFSRGHRINGDAFTFPYWDTEGVGFLPFLVSHIIYGDSLDISDWEVGDVENENTIYHNIGLFVSLF